MAELIAGNKRGRSYERLAQDCGGELTSQRIQQMATKPIKTFPTTASIVGLARGLGVSPARVVMSVATSLGLDMDRAVPPLVNYLPATAAALTSEQMSALGELVRVFTTQDGGQRDGDGHTPAEKTVTSPGEGGIILGRTGTKGVRPNSTS